MKACEELNWNHERSTPRRSETNGIAERAARRVEEGTSSGLVHFGLQESRRADAMECYCYPPKRARSTCGQTPLRKTVQFTMWWADQSIKSRCKIRSNIIKRLRSSASVRYKSFLKYSLTSQKLRIRSWRFASETLPHGTFLFFTCSLLSSAFELHPALPPQKMDMSESGNAIALHQKSRKASCRKVRSSRPSYERRTRTSSSFRRKLSKHLDQKTESKKTTTLGLNWRSSCSVGAQSSRSSIGWTVTREKYLRKYYLKTDGNKFPGWEFLYHHRKIVLLLVSVCWRRKNGRDKVKTHAEDVETCAK